MIRFLKIAFFIAFFSVFLMVAGCYDDNGPAPVIDAWYQKGAASNFYVVQRQDTIYSIAFAFGLDYRELVAVNHLSPPYTILPGQRLRMTHRPPSQTAPTPAPAVRHPVSHALWNWPAKGRILQHYSLNPSGHPGISIGGRLGEPIRATDNGIVVYSGDGVRGYGNLIIVKHNDSYLSAYGFNQYNLVHVGDIVHTDQMIARMGQNDAGRTLLYFEIRRNGVPIDPLLFLR